MKKVTTFAELRTVLNRVTFAPSCVDFEWDWEAHRCDVQDTGETGWLVRTSFTRPDTNTGTVGRGYGRWEFIASGTTESGVIKTCWLLVELIVRHELMEAFLVDGLRLFNPHNTIDDLCLAERLRRKSV